MWRGGWSGGWWGDLYNRKLRDTARHRHDRTQSPAQNAELQMYGPQVTAASVVILQPNRIASERIANEHHATVLLDAAIGGRVAFPETIRVLMIQQAAEPNPSA